MRRVHPVIRHANDRGTIAKHPNVCVFANYISTYGFLLQLIVSLEFTGFNIRTIFGYSLFIYL